MTLKTQIEEIFENWCWGTNSDKHVGLRLIIEAVEKSERSNNELVEDLKNIDRIDIDFDQNDNLHETDSEEGDYVRFDELENILLKHSAPAGQKGGENGR